MANITIDMTGKAGLADNFFGDNDMATPEPSLRQSALPGQVAQGIFNPYLRNGYMAPTSTTSIPVTGASTTKITSYANDETNDDMYLSEYGSKIYVLDSSTDTGLSEALDLGAGNTIHDLDIYELNSDRNLYFTYIGEELVLSNSISSAGFAIWGSMGVKVDPAGAAAINVVAKETFASNITTTKDIVVPSGQSNVTLVVFVREESTVGTTSVELDATPMTQINSEARLIGNLTNSFEIYTVGSLTSGTKTLEIVPTSAAFVGFYVLLSNAGVPIAGDTFIGSGASDDAVVELEQTDGAYYLTAMYAKKSPFDIANSTANGSYDSSAQTGNNTKSLWFKPDGTKMYILGDTAGVNTNPSIYQYSLSAPFQISSGVTYDTKTVNVSAHLSTSFGTMSISSTGEYLYLSNESGDDIFQYTMSTPWDISTATYTRTETLAPPNAQTLYGKVLSNDGERMYVYGTLLNEEFQDYILQYNLSTAWDISTATYYDKIACPLQTPALTMGTAMDDALLWYCTVNREGIIILPFDAQYPGDITRVDNTSYTYNLTAGTISGINLDGAFIPNNGQAFFYCDVNENSVYKRAITLSSVPRFNSDLKTSEEFNSLNGSDKLSVLTNIRNVKVGNATVPGLLDRQTNWLQDKHGADILSASKYNFIRTADNGFAYLFTGNSVHRIDGGFTGGTDGQFAENVLLFPSNFTITDAMDYRSRIYITLSQYPVDPTSTTTRIFEGSCGVFVWDRISGDIDGADYIEIPGLREIKKIYASPDGTIKLIGISNNGLTELRQFGYNDSGGVIFRTMKVLGLGAYPQLPDGLAVVGDKVAWIANDGKIYVEKNVAELQTSIVQIYQLKTPGTQTSSVHDNISSGILALYGGDQTASAGQRTDRQALLLSYKDGSTHTVEKIYPFDVRMGDNTSQTIAAGSVYFPVQYVPVGSVVRSVRIYNYPISGTGTNVAATLKLYFNQSTSATMPNGMTKTITYDEAKRGYVDFKINKPNVQAVQIEVEWNDAVDSYIGDDTYLPSVGLIITEDTEQGGPDNG